MCEKLQNLTDYLLGLDFCPRENIDSWVDLATIIPEPRHQGQYAEICRYHHRCTVLIERFTGDSRLIAAWLAAWLEDYDPDRETDNMPDPEIDVEPLDASGTQWDVDINIEFLEPVMVQQNENGNIQWRMKQWSLIDVPLIDEATDVDSVEEKDNAA